MRIALVSPLAILAGAVGPAPATAPSPELFRDGFDAPVQDNGVIVNSYAQYTGECPQSPDWRNDGGSWLHDPRDDTGWTGRPDGREPEQCASDASTGSAKLRMWTTRTDFLNVRIEVDVRVNELTSFIRGPSTWDGIKIFLRRQTEETPETGDDRFYTVEPFRRDEDVHIQKKREGVYFDAVDTPNGSNPLRPGVWRHITIVARTNPNGTVTLRLAIDGETKAEWTDTGEQLGAAITGPGSVGFRGDNTDFNLDDFVVATLPYRDAVLSTSGLSSYRGGGDLRCAELLERVAASPTDRAYEARTDEPDGRHHVVVAKRAGTVTSHRDGVAVGDADLCDDETILDLAVYDRGLTAAEVVEHAAAR